MPKKRKSRGRDKGKRAGRIQRIQCSNCGKLVPADKVKKVTVWVSPVKGPLARELEKQGAIIYKQRVVKYYCINCAIFYGIVKVRAKEERKKKEPIGRFA